MFKKIKSYICVIIKKSLAVCFLQSVSVSVQGSLLNMSSCPMLSTPNIYLYSP